MTIITSLVYYQVYNQISQIPAGTARKDALRLTKKTAKSLPRVTAYCTARYVKIRNIQVIPLL